MASTVKLGNGQEFVSKADYDAIVKVAGTAEILAEIIKVMKADYDKLAVECAALRGAAVPVGVTAENLRVIQMLLNVCGAAFELADDSCQQDVDGELCHVVPDDAFSSLSNALEEIENTLPDEYEDLPNIVLQWAAIPRHALRNMFTHPAPPLVVPVRTAHAEWSQATFGDVGPVGPLKHLSKEAIETAEAPHDLSEWADMQFLFWDAQRRAGITDSQIEQAMIEKLAINKARTWPGPKDGEPRLHIKSADGEGEV